MPLLELRDLVKSYQTPASAGGHEHVVLDVPQFVLDEGEQCALAGSSGSGKTTLLNVIAGILRPTSGSVLIDGTDLAQLSESERDRLRARDIGYVFQTFNLLQGYSALENVLLGMVFGRGPDPALATELLETLGLGDRLHHRPRQLSLGQQQRVAVARALGNGSRLVLADEPTGSLDHRSAAEALALLRRACEEHGAALLLVSHDRDVLSSFDRVEDLATLNQAADLAAPHTDAGGAA